MKKVEIPKKKFVGREMEIKKMEEKMQFYKRQIEIMKKQLEESYNIDKYFSSCIFYQDRRTRK